MKKLMLLLKYTFLISVVVPGIGIVGAVPVQRPNKNQDKIEFNIELEDLKKTNDEQEQELIVKQ